MDTPMTYRTQNWIVRKPGATSRDGIVASQSRAAAEIGAKVLAEGGNAIDAAVATGFSLATFEPWMSGIGGIGFMVIYKAKERRAHVIDFGAVAPRALDPADYPLAGGDSGDLFGWPAVKDERNVMGPYSIAVPGHVDGLALALEKFGTRSFAEMLQPAIAVAEKGLPIDWYTTLRVTMAARELSVNDAARKIWLPNNMPPITPPGSPLQFLQLGNLAQTLKRLAAAGPRDFYEGAIARDIAADMKDCGSRLDASDLAQYRARLVDPLEAEYRGTKLYLAGGLTAGPSMKSALAALSRRDLGKEPGPAAFTAYAEVLRDVYAERLDALGDVTSPACTTHFCTVDAEGNLVALTQTLLSIFGSRVVSPRTGILMNNGIMWFDPRPGRPNSMAPGKRPLSNMCPVVATRDGKPYLAIGASGGRKIFPAVTQILSFLLDFKLGLEEAFHHPRIDASGGPAVLADPRHPAATLEALGEKFDVTLAEHTVVPGNYASPSATMIDPNGTRRGMSDVMSPWSAAVASA
jgi:gamma-glutamyltranspeptidase / glutathione hydrolase